MKVAADGGVALGVEEPGAERPYGEDAVVAVGAGELEIPEGCAEAVALEVTEGLLFFHAEGVDFAEALDAFAEVGGEEPRLVLRALPAPDDAGGCETVLAVAEAAEIGLGVFAQAARFEQSRVALAGDMDVPADADDVSEAEAVEELEEGRAAEAAVGDDAGLGSLAPREYVGEALDEGVLDGVLGSPEAPRLDDDPRDGQCPAVAGRDRRDQSAAAVAQLDPVEGEDQRCRGLRRNGAGGILSRARMGWRSSSGGQSSGIIIHVSGVRIPPPLPDKTPHSLEK